MLARDADFINGTRRISLAEIDAAVAERLGPARVRGNAQPAAFNRQIAMYLATQLGGWSTTRIGKSYNGRHHTTVCYAIQRIATLRQANTELDRFLTGLSGEIMASWKIWSETAVRPPRVGLRDALIAEEFLERLADRFVDRITSKLAEAISTGKPVAPPPPTSGRAKVLSLGGSGNRLLLREAGRGALT